MHSLILKLTSEGTKGEIKGCSTGKGKGNCFTQTHFINFGTVSFSAGQMIVKAVSSPAEEFVETGVICTCHDSVSQFKVPMHQSLSQQGTS